MLPASQFNQLTPAQQLDTLRDTLRATRNTKRTSNARSERAMARIEAHQKRRDAVLADALTFCPELFDGEPLHVVI